MLIPKKGLLYLSRTAWSLTQRKVVYRSRQARCPLPVILSYNVILRMKLRDPRNEGSNPGGGRDFPHPSRPVLGPTQTPIQ
jgi:hypothetical protein